MDYLNQILNGESLDILRQIPDNSVDAVITDPPYSSGGSTLAQKTQDPVKKYEQSSNKIVHRASFLGDNRDTRSWLHWCVLWISECHRILKPGGYFLMFSDWRQLPTATDAIQMGEMAWRGIVVWDKKEGARAPHKGYFRHQAEYIVWGTKGACPKAEHAGFDRETYRINGATGANCTAWSGHRGSVCRIGNNIGCCQKARQELHRNRKRQGDLANCQ